MTDHEWKRLRSIAVGYARQRGLNELAEDFAQEYLIEVLKDRKVLMRLVFIDFLRKEFGRYDNKAGGARSKATRFLRPIIDEPNEFCSPNKAYVQYCKDYVKSPLDQVEEKEEKEYKERFLQRIYRRLTPKPFKWKRGSLANVLKLTLEGNSRKETSKIMNINVEYVTQILTKALNMLKTMPKFKPRND